MKTEIMAGGWLMGYVKEIEPGIFEARIANEPKSAPRATFLSFGEAAVEVANSFADMLDALSSDEFGD